MAGTGEIVEEPSVVEIEVESVRVREEDLELIKFAREQLFLKSTDTLDDMAKSLIALVSTITALFISVMTFFKTDYSISSTSGVLILLSLVCWLASIYRNVTAYSPRAYEYEENNPESIKKAILGMNRYKYDRLKEGTLLFIAGLLLLALAVFATVFSG